MSNVFKYGIIQYAGAKPGDAVRFVDGPKAGHPGAITRPRTNTEVNAVLETVKGSQGFCRIKTQLKSAQAGAEAGTASGISIKLPVVAGGSLKIG